jgi:hypothetical protein
MHAGVAHFAGSTVPCGPSSIRTKPDSRNACLTHFPQFLFLAQRG